ncbi:CheA1 [Desulfamplus magnetovallimortis]|uniref:Chemotaxis protein CheA n=1 Tax=Desulfamplus magnetovallimortis TaxID=1246637 RepID=A0A1W1HGM4_9BACT|nr:chemotaxis protein CheA [Desulfamplus magnetovallimortis]SLM31532.1 CheA1 [Desulfamplus magnetovallimortis]
MKRLKRSIDDLSSQVASLCLGEAPDLDIMLNTLQEIDNISSELNADTITTVTRAYTSYVKTMASQKITNVTPLEQGLTLLNALVRHLEKNIDFIFDISDVLKILDSSLFDPREKQVTEKRANPPSGEETVNKSINQEEKTLTGDNSPDLPKKTEHIPVSEEDLIILGDFVAEAEDNLETIEVELIELEQDPGNKEIINNIFRPFHTIKGVSGFLDLKKINRLSHSTENLLDGARNGDFLINDTAADAILESVDLLKKLLEKVHQGIAGKYKPVDDDINIEPLRQKLQRLVSLLGEESKEPVGQILVRKGVIDDNILDDALAQQSKTPGKKIGEILLETEKAGSSDIAAALMEQKPGRKYTSTQVKVNTSKLDDLVDYAGELVIAQSMLKQQAYREPSLSQSINQLEQIVSNIQKIAMSMRMIPIHATFMKMIRLVRDLSRKSKKNVVLTMSGEDTEIDRNVVDALYEPMVHMIRNSIDHGIESAEERKIAQKPVQGNIFLRAYHKGGSIIIEIEDDGKGLDKDKILAKAISRNMIRQDTQMTDGQIYDLILAPGFSTAAAITDISGRGVGMDVVKDAIERFRGELGITSKPGQGTRFTISLPLTLAIIDGMLVRIGKEKYVIPTVTIQRSFRPEEKDCFTVKGKGEMIRERNELIPLIRMKNLCDVDNDVTTPWEGLVVVVEAKEEKRCLLVDELLGKDEYVIKSLGGHLENITGFSGGAILGDGKVGLILDIHGIFELASTM